MSTKAVREYDGKVMLRKFFAVNTEFSLPKTCQVTPLTSLTKLPNQYPWLLEQKLVVKPDQLIKRRGKAGLLKLNATFEEVCAWINERRGKSVQVEVVSGVLDHFIIEPFCPHEQADEYYIAITSDRQGDLILFHHEGGVDVGDVDAKATKFRIPTGENISVESLKAEVLGMVPDQRRAPLASFIFSLYSFYVTLHYSYLEINPLVMTADNKVTPLDLAAKIDETARFECSKYWGKVDFPAPFGRVDLPEEAFIADLDGKTGASLKLTVLKPKGRVWTMVAGGGASVIYADTLADLGAGEEMANYGEYSGAPSEAMTFAYAKTILELMTQEARADGKVLIIGGGIANFTNVASTFKGIIRAITLFQDKIRAQQIKLYVRRGGPNYQEGLDSMRALSAQLDLPIEVYGPETHMTSIVPMALGLPVKDQPVTCNEGGGGNDQSSMDKLRQRTPNMSRVGSMVDLDKMAAKRAVQIKPLGKVAHPVEEVDEMDRPYNLFHSKTRAIVYGLQVAAVQNMLDFDFVCGREKPSVAAMVYPFTGNHYQKFYWNTSEILIPVIQSLAEACAKFPEVDVCVNFASFRSVFETTSEMLGFPQLKTIALIAEGVPERRTRQLLRMAKQNNVTIIGPATVGGIKPGCFRIGNTGGMLDNIIASKLYRPGSVAYVARSGGMSNEMNNIISQHSDGVYEGIAIGGDRYPGTTFVDHLLRYQANPAVKMMIVLGEVGGVEEYEICRLIDVGTLTKPIVAWCIGTCAKMFPYQVQFGHAGASANDDSETADAKNDALRERGVIVPDSFEDLGFAIRRVYDRLVEEGTIVPKEEVPPPTIPVDYDWARKLGLIRKPAQFVSSIVDERGEELIYAGMKISDVFRSNLGVGGVLGLIWFRRRLPDYFCRFIEMVLMVTADHGPAVSGAHNTIVCARAGKDLISSLVSGLLTIGPRFGGALDGAAQKFTWAYDQGLTAQEFVDVMRKKKELIMGIGHKIKSMENPDVRVTIIKSFVRRHFKSTEIFDFALEVEKVCTKKKSNLILNVDGAIGIAFVDLMRSCGAFTREEAREYVAHGTLNGLFVLGRSIGFIGHYLDQKRLKQGLYRHPTDDVSYLVGRDLTI